MNNSYSLVVVTLEFNANIFQKLETILEYFLVKKIILFNWKMMEILIAYALNVVSSQVRRFICSGKTLFFRRKETFQNYKYYK